MNVWGFIIKYDRAGPRWANIAIVHIVPCAQSLCDVCAAYEGKQFHQVWPQLVEKCEEPHVGDLMMIAVDIKRILVIFYWLRHCREISP